MKSRKYCNTLIRFYFLCRFQSYIVTHYSLIIFHHSSAPSMTTTPLSMTTMALYHLRVDLNPAERRACLCQLLFRCSISINGSCCCTIFIISSSRSISIVNSGCIISIINSCSRIVTCCCDIVATGRSDDIGNTANPGLLNFSETSPAKKGTKN